MSAPKTPAVPMRRGLRILLIASLAVNIAVAGLAIGAAFNWKTGGPPRAFEFGSGQLGRALAREDRRAIGEALRRDPNLRLPSRSDVRRVTAQMAGIIRSEPFERDALEAIMGDLQGRVANVRGATSEMIIDRVAAMTPDQRATFADALEQGSERGAGDRQKRD